jgi:predicted transcriptional regulator
MLAKDIMPREITTVKPDLSVQELAKVFAHCRISGAPVVAENGRVTGVSFQTVIF